MKKPRVQSGIGFFQNKQTRIKFSRNLRKYREAKMENNKIFTQFGLFPKTTQNIYWIWESAFISLGKSP